MSEPPPQQELAPFDQTRFTARGERPIPGALSRIQAGIRRHWRGELWITALVAAGAALVLGWFGYDEYFDRIAHASEVEGPAHTGWDRLYASLLLLAFEFDHHAGVQVPPALNWARYLAFFVALFAVIPFIDLAVRYLRRQAAQRRAKNSTDHTVIVGEDETARRLLALHSRRRVVWVRRATGDFDDPSGQVVVVAGQTPRDLLDTVKGAHSIVVTDRERIADVHSAWAKLEGGRHQPVLVIEVEDPGAEKLFQERQGPYPGAGLVEFHLDVFSPTGLTARRLVAEAITALDRRLWSGALKRPATVLLKGAGPLADHTADELGQHWSHRSALVANYAATNPGAMHAWRDPYALQLEIVRDTDSPSPRRSALEHVEVRHDSGDIERNGLTFDIGLFLDRSSEKNLEDLRSARSVDASITCWTATDAAAWLVGAARGDLIDPLTYGLDALSARESVEGRFEVLARRIHFAYLLANFPTALRPGYRPPADDRMSARQPWETLNEYYREQNRSQCRHFAHYAAEVGLTIGRAGSDMPAHVPADQIERLARLEHERWCEVATANGWRTGPRNDVARTHPDLIPFDELSSSSKDKDRQTIVDMPWHLASVDLALYLAKPTTAGRGG